MEVKVVEKKSFYTIYEVYIEKIEHYITFLFTNSKTNINLITMYYGKADQAKNFNLSFILAIRDFDTVFTSSEFVFSQLINDEKVVLHMVECAYEKTEYEGTIVDISTDGKVHECEFKLKAHESVKLW